MRYELFLESEVHAARKDLPGHVRQRMRRIIEELTEDPRPSASRALNSPAMALPTTIEVRRFRLDRWRLIYAVCDSEQWVWLLAVRQRPPYDYQDLHKLIQRFSGEAT